MNVAILQTSDLVAWTTEGRFWRAGRIHRVTRIDLDARGVVKNAEAKCGRRLSLPYFGQGDADQYGTPCRRCA